MQQDHNIRKAIDGQTKDFRDVEQITKYLAKNHYDANELLTQATTKEEKQRLGYITDVANTIAQALGTNNHTLRTLKRTLDDWLEEQEKPLDETTFTTTTYLSQEHRNAYANKWRVLSDYTEHDILDHPRYQDTKDI